MATNRDVQSARVTKKKLKDVQYVNKTQTQQKKINKMACPIRLCSQYMEHQTEIVTRGSSFEIRYKKNKLGVKMKQLH